MRVNWDNSNQDPCCCYIILCWVTALQSAYSPTSRGALQAWGCVPGSGSTLRRAGLKPEHSPWEDCITATQGFPATADHDLPLCSYMCVSLHVLAHIPIRVTRMHTQGSSVIHNRSYFYLLFAHWCKVRSRRSRVWLPSAIQGWTWGSGARASAIQIGQN